MKSIQDLSESLLKQLYNYKNCFREDKAEVYNDGESTYIGNKYGAVKVNVNLTRKSDKYALDGRTLSESQIVPLFLSPFDNYERKSMNSQPIKIKLGQDKRYEMNYFIHTKKIDCIYAERFGYFFGDFNLPNIDTNYMLPAKVFYSIMEFFKNGYYEISAWDKGIDNKYLFIQNDEIQAVIKNKINDYALGYALSDFEKIRSIYILGK